MKYIVVDLSHFMVHVVMNIEDKASDNVFSFRNNTLLPLLCFLCGPISNLKLLALLFISKHKPNTFCSICFEMG